ncbi:MAG TPA: cob(I)yrinic acid a,c-diamide adenosyltransferase [Aggregatilineales bacterium]|nr:cob(I)yrinic acid a,c-diamide adenosyltransferase [Aggregatilineales bacterium]
MKIYTRTGDEGQTSLFAGGRASKDSRRLHAYGTVDELNSMIGLVLAQDVSDDVSVWLNEIQNDLFVVGSDLATPLDAEAKWITRVSEAEATRLEHEIDQMDEQLTELRSFILPGGTPGAAALHVARTVCRRAERWTVAVAEHEAINPAVLQYLNRLSDWLFTAARYENRMAGREETTWQSPSR